MRREWCAVVLSLVVVSCGGGGNASSGGSVGSSTSMVTTSIARPTTTAAPTSSTTGTDSAPSESSHVHTDQPCTASEDGDNSARLGLALHEVAAMTIDLREEGLDAGRWTYESGFMDNAKWAWEWEEGCDAAITLGRLTGHSQSLTDWNAFQETAATPQVLSLVHVFSADTGAQEYIEWVREADPWPCFACNGAGSMPATNATAAIDELPGIGDDATLVMFTSDQSDRQVALVRVGSLVAEVAAIGPPGETPDVDIAALAAKAAERVAAVTPTGEPHDLMQVLSGPLTLAEWGPDYSDFVWDVDYAGGRDNWSLLQTAPDPQLASTDIDLHGRLVGYQNNYYSDDGPTWIATSLVVYPDPASAQGALDTYVIARLETPDAREFDVPGVDGARGIARYAYDELATEVFFLHGSVLARAHIIQQGPTATDGSADHTSEVARIATLWAPLLDAVLGTDGR